MLRDDPRDDPPEAPAPRPVGRPDLRRPSYRNLVRAAPAHIIRPILEAENPTEDEMVAALMTSPMSQRKSQQAGQREAYVEWLKRGHAGSTPAPFRPRPARPPVRRMASFAGSSASDSTDNSLEDRILAAMVAREAKRSAAAGS